MRIASAGRIMVLAFGVVGLLGVLALPQEVALTVWEVPYENSFPGGIALGPNGTVFTVANGGQEAFRLDPARDLFRSWGVGDRPADVTVVDGVVFCTVENDGLIVYFNPDGAAVSTAVIPFADVKPREIHRGTDTASGNIGLWVAERGGSGVLRFEYNPQTDAPAAVGEPSDDAVVPENFDVVPITIETSYERFQYELSLMPSPAPLSVARTDHPFAEWTFFTGRFSVQDLAVAGDGKLWISLGAPLLFRLDPIAGTIQEMETIHNVETFQGLLPAADGSIWFTNRVEGAIGHFDPALGLSETWRIPATVEIFDLVFDPDGTIWYTDRIADTIGNLNTWTGEATIYPVPAGSEPLYLQIDDAGDVWFTAGSGNYIARLTPAE